MKKIAIVLTYFGTPKPYFKFFLESAAKNNTVDFFFAGMDQKLIPNEPNFHYIAFSIFSFKRRLEEITKESGIVIYPYKSAEYRPAIGLIFDDILKDYDYWGYCDPDIILGNIRGILDKVLEEEYQRVLELGHFCLYKNEASINSFFLHRQDGKYVGRSFSYISHVQENCHFDEMGGINQLWASFKLDKWYRNNLIFSDISFASLEMKNANYSFRNRVFYKWDGGRLFEYLIKGKACYKKEMLYVHFQKRKVDVDDNLSKDLFYFFNNRISSVVGFERCFRAISKFSRLFFSIRRFAHKSFAYLKHMFQMKKSSVIPLTNSFDKMSKAVFDSYLVGAEIIQVKFKVPNLN